MWPWVALPGLSAFRILPFDVGCSMLDVGCSGPTKQRTQRNASGWENWRDHLPGESYPFPKFPSLRSLRSLWWGNCCFLDQPNSPVHRYRSSSPS
jgi:hypothetical protein